MGHDDPWLRWRRLHGVSTQVEIRIDTRLIHDHRIYIQEPPSGGFSIGNRADVTSVIGAFPTGAGLQADTGLRSEFVG
jgi:hypothetical protein